jgi:outer membrane protein assembly factor BamE (lipoprotein component of BamABCDE complex)
MVHRTFRAAGAAVTLYAVPRAAQDTTSTKKDTLAPQPDTTAARKDSVVPAQPVAAPAPDSAVRPGMTADEVKARWGEPLATRTVNDWTYIFYRNRRERAVGYFDVVMLQHDQVMDAIVRSPDHVYAGVSSSPEGRVPVYTPPAHQAADSSQGAAVTGVRVKPSP